MHTVAISSYSFHRLIKANEMALIDVPRLARTLGATAIEFALGGPLSDPPDHALMHSLREECDAVGTEITGVCIAAELLRGDEADRHRAIESVIAQMEAIAEVGIRRFRHDATLGPEDGDLSDQAFEESLTSLVPACRTIAEHAATLGVASSIENHGCFIQHAHRVSKLVQEVDHPAFGLTLDVGNLLFADQDPLAATTTLMPYAINLHLKDFVVVSQERPGTWLSFPGGLYLMPCVLGDGHIDVGRCIESAQQCQYSGPFVLEYEAPFGDVRRGIQTGLSRLREQLAHYQTMPGSQ